LEQLARERGTLQTSRVPCIGPSAGNSTNAENGQCVVPVFGLEINTASFAMYTFSLAVLIQALTLISFSALADYGMVAERRQRIYSAKKGHELTSDLFGWMFRG
jgi:UMF1 family MFS transporter